MKNGKLKAILFPTLALFLICLIATALLALTNEATATTQTKCRNLGSFWKFCPTKVFSNISAIGCPAFFRLATIRS